MTKKKFPAEQVKVPAEAPASPPESTDAKKSEQKTAGFQPLRFDPQEFVNYVIDHDLTEKQAEALLGAIWAIAVSFVDLGLGILPEQQVLDKSLANEVRLAARRTRVVSSRHAFSKSTHRKAEASSSPRRVREKKDS